MHEYSFFTSKPKKLVKNGCIWTQHVPASKEKTRDKKGKGNGFTGAATKKKVIRRTVHQKPIPCPFRVGACAVHRRLEPEEEKFTCQPPMKYIYDEKRRPGGDKKRKEETCRLAFTLRTIPIPMHELSGRDQQELRRKQSRPRKSIGRGIA